MTVRTFAGIMIGIAFFDLLAFTIIPIAHAQSLCFEERGLASAPTIYVIKNRLKREGKL